MTENIQLTKNANNNNDNRQLTNNANNNNNNYNNSSGTGSDTSIIIPRDHTGKLLITMIATETNKIYNVNDTISFMSLSDSSDNKSIIKYNKIFKDL